MLSVSTLAQDKTYFDRLNLLRSEISDGAKENFQLEYISIFPNNFKNFTKTFGYFPKRKVKNLYHNSHEHISTLVGISKKQPKKVMELMLNIAVDGTWDADAVSHLQHSLVKLIKDRMDIFLSSFSIIKKDKQNTIIRFLADVENHYVYDDYKAILKMLKKQNKSLYDEFLTAKNKRMKHKH
ncbi:MAG: hypothetical protein CL678_08235 [Bdellovibrionaceae bacterium]|nr:hypothetical protein [Pseudobdellovibrionaceae bacterium]